jgi:hypothetical protein
VRKPAIRPTRAIRASCRAGAASGHATAPQPSSVLNSRRFIANSVPGVLNASVGIFSARVQADGCPNWVTNGLMQCNTPLLFDHLVDAGDVALVIEASQISTNFANFSGPNLSRTIWFTGRSLSA